MNWKKLETISQLDEIAKKDKALIFKHSTRCSISTTALDRLQRHWKEQEMQNIDVYLLDLIAFREISKEIAVRFGVEHESPQVLWLSHGKCTYTESHYGIAYDALRQLNQA